MHGLACRCVTPRTTHVRAHSCARMCARPCLLMRAPWPRTCVSMYVCVHVHPVTHLAPVFCQWNSKAGRVLFLAKINVIGSLVFRMESPAWVLPAALFAPLNLKRFASYPTAPPAPPPPAPLLPPTTTITTRLSLSLVLCLFKIRIHFGHLRAGYHFLGLYTSILKHTILFTILQNLKSKHRSVIYNR